MALELDWSNTRSLEWHSISWESLSRQILMCLKFRFLTTIPLLYFSGILSTDNDPFNCNTKLNTKISSWGFDSSAVIACDFNFTLNLCPRRVNIT